MHFWYTLWLYTYACEVAQSCPTLCDPMDCSLPGSSIHGVFQATVLEWGAITEGTKRTQKEEISSDDLKVVWTLNLISMQIQIYWQSWKDYCLDFLQLLCSHCLITTSYGNKEKKILKLALNIKISIICWAYTLRTQNWKRHMYPNIHCSTVYNKQGMEAT